MGGRSFCQKTGLYGKLFDSVVGMIGFAIVMFWVFAGVYGAMDLIVTHDSLAQVSGMKNKLPGTPTPEDSGLYPVYLLGGDNLARDRVARVLGAHRDDNRLGHVGHPVGLGEEECRRRASR